MMDIMKSIYDMMGKYTYPCMQDEAPREHVESFFQKMDRNNDGVVTIDEFIESCQKTQRREGLVIHTHNHIKDQFSSEERYRTFK
ncbi:unnamed protein product [Coregonus sp. 'balchen']|nr:unnamed protein product [Coregonus sp. 'balchen']